MTEPRVPEPDPAPSGRTSALPFLLALALVGAAIVLSVVLLPSEEGRLVLPERIGVMDGTRLRVLAPDQPACERIERAQADFDDDRVFLELVAVEVPGCDRDDERVDVEAFVTLPEPIGEREVVAGAGRTRLPCAPEGERITCAPPR